MRPGCPLCKRLNERAHAERARWHAFAFWCWSQALARIRASTASQVLLLSPVFGITQSHFVLGEPLTPAVLASAACVITGACLTFWRPAPAAPA